MGLKMTLWVSVLRGWYTAVVGRECGHTPTHVGGGVVVQVFFEGGGGGVLCVTCVCRRAGVSCLFWWGEGRFELIDPAWSSL